MVYEDQPNEYEEGNVDPDETRIDIVVDFHVITHATSLLRVPLSLCPTKSC